ncbi:MAG: DUF3887 domain-containing protein [Actinobacteria bacterium]|nr:DUF3887 domain-containing protein [Actinomycetota bacterium]
MKKGKLCLAVLALLFWAAALAGCGSEPVDEEKVRRYADPITENVLTAVNEGSYEKFSRDFDRQMKSSLPEQTFREFSADTRAKIGNYSAKEFLKAERQKQYTVVYYRAQFTREKEDVIIKAVFSETGGRELLSGFFMDSNGLRKK